MIWNFSHRFRLASQNLILLAKESGLFFQLCQTCKCSVIHNTHGVIGVFHKTQSAVAAATLISHLRIKKKNKIKKRYSIAENDVEGFKQQSEDLNL